MKLELVSDGKHLKGSSGDRGLHQLQNQNKTV